MTESNAKVEAAATPGKEAQGQPNSDRSGSEKQAPGQGSQEKKVSPNDAPKDSRKV